MNVEVAFVFACSCSRKASDYFCQVDYDIEPVHKSLEVISEFGELEMDVVVACEFFVSSCASNEIHIYIVGRTDVHGKEYVDSEHSQTGIGSCRPDQLRCDGRVDRLEMPVRKGVSS